MLETLLSLFEKYKNTCSITNVHNNCVTFARNAEYLKYLSGVQKNIWVIVPEDISTPSSSTGSIKYYHSKYPEYEFTLFHNYLNKNKKYQNSSIGKDCKLHETVVIGVEGLKIVNTPNGSKIQFIHTGKVVIKDNVEIGPYSVIHRGTIENTIIENGCKFGAYTNIGHNCHIEKNTIMAAGVILNGGVKIGKGCWISSGVKIKHYVNVCDDVVIGLGSVVVKDITKPGIYVGNPLRFLKPKPREWNF